LDKFRQLQPLLFLLFLLSLTFPSPVADWRRLGWMRVDDPKDATLQWAKARDVAWDQVLQPQPGRLATNNLLLKTALTRKADLATLLTRSALTHSFTLTPDP
jgi:hypothetical protein